MENKDSTRTKKIKEAEIQDDFMGIKKGVKYGATKLSEGLDSLGITQEEQYKNKDTKKKASGGVIKSSASKRADGCAVRGKTKGRMI